MFAEHTVNSIIALACIDKGVTDSEKDELQRVLLGRRRPCAVVKYRDAATRLGMTLPTIKRLVKEGRLRSVQGTGKRAFGIAEESLERFAG